ncbi:MAG: type II secretion system secretin GspD [Gammaproteobacteria bacterium]|nr:type II secretion system secretin GspD [Gammaproteobacteria bacterium]
MYRVKRVFNSSELAGIFLASVMVVLSGCASAPDYRVGVESANVTRIGRYDDSDFMGDDSDLPTTVSPVVRYGNEKIMNKPVKRSYSGTQGKFSLDFVNISIAEFVSVVFTEMLRKNYVLDDALKGEVTVQTRGQVNSSQLLSIVESVLASKSAVMIPRDNHFELVPLAKAKNVSLKPELFSARNVKPGFRMVVVPVNHVNPEDLKGILESVAPGAMHLNVDKERRAVIVTGSEQEISNVVDAVQIFDVDWLASKSIALFPVKNAQASIVVKEINKILSSQNKSHDIVLDTFERFNAVLVVASKKAEIDAVREWLGVLDVVVQTADTQLFVYDVQNRKATELAEMLNGIFGEGGASQGSSKSDAKTASTREVVVTNKANEKQVAKRNPSKKSENQLKIVSDETNNAIVIMATRPQYESILSVIKDLDVLPLQVLIEVSIIEVTLTDELSYGVEWFLQHNDLSNGKFNAESTLDLNAGAGIGAIAPGFSFLMNGSGSLVQAVFNTLAAESKLNVISSPSLMALDNHTATIRVGNQQPVQVASAKSSDNDVLTQSIEFKSTGVLLSVTPRVNSGGLVTMELSQEVTDVGGIDDATGQRSFLQRNINSTVAVQDGRTIVLGGLITENEVESESGLPGLHGLPIIGALFGKTSTSTVKSELIVLITPKVIFNHENATRLTREYAQKLELLKSSIEIVE